MKNLLKLAEEERTIVLYESVYRINKLVEELSKLMPYRQAIICRELTKMFEEIIRGTLSSIKDELPNHTLKGEFVVVIAPQNWEDSSKRDYSLE
jgi:16S rRNA (cytidine1402-2'-O)-methyltransferase